MRIYLVGFMGAGKSTYGNKLAKKLKLEFMDLDEMIEAKAGKSVDQIFKEDGEEAFRNLEAEVLRESSTIDQVVIATGGGAAAHAANMNWMNKNGITVYIKLFENKIFNRLWKAKTSRPLIEGMDQNELRAFIHDKLQWRGMEYMKAHYIVQPEAFQPKHLAEVLTESNAS